MEDKVVLFVPTEATIRSIVKQELQEFLHELLIYLKEMNQPEYLTAKETADLLHLSIISIRRHTKNGYLTPVRIGRRVMYRYSDIKERLERRNQTRWKLAA